jgi:hypothetical protein
MYELLPIIVLTFSAIVCWISIWAASHGRQLKQSDYTLLCKTGIVTYPIMCFVVLKSTLTVVFLTSFTGIAILCYSLLFIAFTLGTFRLNSKRFRIITLGGMLGYIGWVSTVPFIPKILDWLGFS